MSSKYNRTVFSRPRTKVYDTCYNIGESYYKSALDGLDRKYGRPRSIGEIDFAAPAMDRSIFDRSQESQSMRTGLKRMEDEFFQDRRSQTSNLLKEYDFEFDGRSNNRRQRARTPMRGGRSLERDMEEMENAMGSSMKGLKAVKFARTMADEFGDLREGRPTSKLSFSDKVMESVGLTEKARSLLGEEGATGKRRTLRTANSDFGEAEELTKWTALKPTLPRRYLLEEDDEERSSSEVAAAARARKSRARLEDLESEMKDLSERAAAREKRVRDLKALVQENEASALDNFHTAVRVNSSIESEKNVTF